MIFLEKNVHNLDTIDESGCKVIVHVWELDTIVQRIFLRNKKSILPEPLRNGLKEFV